MLNKILAIKISHKFKFIIFMVGKEQLL